MAALDPQADPTLAQLVPEHRLRRLELAVTRRLDGLLHGQYRGLLPGAGSEPRGSREYRAGEDEVRRMDWAVTARTGVPHVREVDADRELSTWALVDTSPSMDFGTAELEKRELAVAAVAAVGFITTGTGNRFGGYLLGPDGPRRYPARSGRAHLLGMLRTLLAAPRVPGRPAASSLADALCRLDRSLIRSGLVVVVSDFLDGLPEGSPGGLPEGADGTPDWERPLRRLGSRHQLLAIEVTDPRELELPDVGLITFVDPESGLSREVDTGDRRLRERFAAAAAEQGALVGRALRRAGAAHLALRTDQDWITELARHLRTRRRCAQAARPGSGLAGAGVSR
jgi:uncharacterized protein (DUF58 family)